VRYVNLTLTLTSFMRLDYNFKLIKHGAYLSAIKNLDLKSSFFKGTIKV
jgi:hypothetical protein